MIEDALRQLVERFNRKADRTPSIQEELAGVSRSITLKLAQGPSYTIDLRDGHLTNLRPGANGGADLTIATDAATFEGLLAKEIGPMKALVTRKLTIEGSLEDKLLFRKLL
ncbi:MAG TPA: SCP2 sterol-binding domain-containing protein [Thermoplasmata archaeon]|nr:SCP2 sterol-binding domain-containing protein [Thermoplasmata archaeon]